MSRDLINQQRNNVVGVPLTTKLRDACAYRVLIPVAFMAPNPVVTSPRPLATSVALVDHLRVLDKNRFEQPRMGYISKAAVGGIELALSYLFDIR